MFKTVDRTNAMKFPMEITSVEFNGKTYVLTPTGQVRVSKTRHGTFPFRAKWSEPESDLAQKVRNEWTKA